MITMAFRDIRTDLSERIAAIREERRRLGAQLKELESLEAMYVKAIETEERRVHSEDLTINVTANSAARFLEAVQSVREAARTVQNARQFVLNAMKDGRNWNLTELKGLASAEGVLTKEGASIGRTLQAALMGLKQQGFVTNLGGGVWKMAKRDAGPENPLAKVLESGGSR
jgi:hypothetical protein